MCYLVMVLLCRLGLYWVISGSVCGLKCLVRLRLILWVMVIFLLLEKGSVEL